MGGSVNFFYLFLSGEEKFFKSAKTNLDVSCWSYFSHRFADPHFVVPGSCYRDLDRVLGLIIADQSINSCI